jgi:hypothetical protein
MYALLFRSVLAASSAGRTVARSSTVTRVWPRRRRWYAVLIPKQPARSVQDAVRERQVTRVAADRTGADDENVRIHS